MSVGWFGFSLLPLPTARPPAPPRAPTATATEQTAAKTAPAPRRAAAGEAQAGVQGSAHGGGQRRGERALGSGWPRPQGRTGGRAAGHSPQAGPSRASTRRPGHPRNSDVLTARAALASGEQGSVRQRAGGRGRHTSPQTPVCVEQVIRRWTVSTVRGQLTPHRQSLGPRPQWPLCRCTHGHRGRDGRAWTGTPPGGHASSARATIRGRRLVSEPCFSLLVNAGPRERNSFMPPARGQGQHHGGRSR